MSSSNNRDAAEEMARAIRDIGKQYTRETRLAAWVGLSSSSGKSEIKKLLVTPTRALSGVRQLNFKEWIVVEDSATTKQPMVKLNFSIQWHSKYEEDVHDIKGDLEKLIGKHFKIWTPTKPQFGMRLLCMFDLDPTDSKEMIKDYHQRSSTGQGVSADSTKLSPAALDAMQCVRNCLSVIWGHYSLFHTTDQGLALLTFISPGQTESIFNYTFPENNGGGHDDWDNNDDTDKPTPPHPNPKGEKVPWFVAV